MKIGTDVSIAECRRSGYMVMEYKKRDLIHKGVLDKDCPVIFSASNPAAWNDSGKPMIGITDLWSFAPTWYSWNDLIQIVNVYRKEIASCCDWENCPIEFDNPTEYDLLRLASDINATGCLWDY